MAQQITENDINLLNYLKFPGNSGVPSTPAAGTSKMYMAGSSNVRPAFMNELGTEERFTTNGGVTGALRGLVAQRQGGNSGVATWQSSGTTNTDTSASNVLVQMGRGTSSAGGGVTITFPTAYSQPPLVFVQIEGGGGSNYAAVDTTPTTSGFNFAVWTLAGALAVKEVAWLAIGLA